MRTRFQEERRILKESRKPTTPKTKGGSVPEFGAVTIAFKPNPDSQDRLRRLYSLLLEHAAERQPAWDEGQPEYKPAAEDAEAE